MIDILEIFNNEAFSIFFLNFKNFFINWWWTFTPVILFFILNELYLYWKQEKWWQGIKWVTLEAKIPEEVEKTPKAMEQVIHGFHGIHDPPNLKERYIDGKALFHLSLEIVGIGGDIHFIIRAPERHRNLVESNIYAQYPDAEIREVDDYTLNVPPDIPNKDYELWGADFTLTKPDPYPIRTYPSFESEATKEEKRIDPISSLCELMSSLKEGEQLWVQILIRPIIEERKWVEEGQKLVNKILGRKLPKKGGLLSGPHEYVREGTRVVVMGEPPMWDIGEGAPGEEPLMWKLTPGETEVIKAIEANISKVGCETNLRFIYLAKSDIFYKPNASAVFGVFRQFHTLNLNGFRPDKKSMTKITYFLVNRRLYLRKRKLFRYYKGRDFPAHRLPYVFNTEELATVYHFPGRIAVPAAPVSRVEARKGAPPPTLPTE